uniref:SFRICE_010456 n=1 Tax=Spodoptera frugiperda TaxID=7108 RepID=A0A2H1VLB5_SPOFR
MERILMTSGIPEVIKIRIQTRAADHLTERYRGSGFKQEQERADTPSRLNQDGKRHIFSLTHLGGFYCYTDMDSTAIEDFRIKILPLFRGAGGNVSNQ